MTLLRKMKIAPKLGLGFGAVLMLAIILGVFSLLQMSKLNANVLDIGNNWMASITYISKVRFDASSLRRWESNYLLTTDRPAAQRTLDATMTAIQEDEQTYEPTITSEEERSLYQGFRSAWDKHVAAKDHM